MEERSISASLSRLAATITDFLADRRGAPLIIGFVLVAINFVFQFIPALGWIAEYHVFLHLGVLFAIAGTLLTSAL
jgi:hypothetical protein